MTAEKSLRSLKHYGLPANRWDISKTSQPTTDYNTRQVLFSTAPLCTPIAAGVFTCTISGYRCGIVETVALVGC
jgi:hypothetical protein